MKKKTRKKIISCCFLLIVFVVALVVLKPIITDSLYLEVKGAEQSEIKEKIFLRKRIMKTVKSVPQKKSLRKNTIHATDY